MSGGGVSAYAVGKNHDVELETVAFIPEAVIAKSVLTAWPLSLELEGLQLERSAEIKERTRVLRSVIILISYESSALRNVRSTFGPRF